MLYKFELLQVITLKLQVLCTVLLQQMMMQKHIPEATAWHSEEPKQSKDHSQGQQSEHVEKGVQTEEEAKNHQLHKDTREKQENSH